MKRTSLSPAGKEVNDVWSYHKYLGLRWHDRKDGRGKRPEGFCHEGAAGRTMTSTDHWLRGLPLSMWDWYTGFLVWKSQNPWPALQGTVLRLVP
ncbi:MAG: hypothetical protein MZV63_34945 [Marinilabiliales bacterium]|nr:hypothetical protein [Marinilabiliales bacterium]